MHKTLKGAKDLLTHHGLSKAYEKYCQKKVKDTLSHFLPDLKKDKSKLQNTFLKGVGSKLD